jgi:hypothetical protein
MYRIVYDYQGFWKIEILRWNMWWCPVCEILIRSSLFGISRSYRVIRQFATLTEAEAFAAATGISAAYSRQPTNYFEEEKEHEASQTQPESSNPQEVN